MQISDYYGRVHNAPIEFEQLSEPLVPEFFSICYVQTNVSKCQFGPAIHPHAHAWRNPRILLNLQGSKVSHPGEPVRQGLQHGEPVCTQFRVVAGHHDVVEEVVQMRAQFLQLGKDA